MSHPEPLAQGMESVSIHFPKVRRPQSKVLAYWSDGMVLAKSCGLSLVCASLTIQLHCHEGESDQTAGRRVL